MFNQEKFSKILNKIAKQYGNITYFANAASVGRSYLSKYINNKLPSPPTPKILEKIAEASGGITNYDELMHVCGYLNSNISSKEIVAQNICKNYEADIDNLNIKDIDKDFIFEILIKQEEHNTTVINQINNFIKNNYGSNSKTNKLFDIITEIDQQIKNIVTVSNNIGIPLYCISKVPMYKVSYFPFEYSNNGNYIAIKAITDKMLPLLGPDDIAVIQLQENIIDGQTVLLLIDNSYYEIAKIFSEANICKLYFMNSKYEELELSRIKIIGEVVLSQNKSAFQRKGGI